MLMIKALSWRQVPRGMSHWRAEVKVNYMTHQEILEKNIWKLFPFTSPLLPSWRRKWQPTPVFWPGGVHGLKAWQAIVHRVAKSWTRLSNTHTHTHTHTPPCRQLLWTETHRRPDLDAKESGRQVNSVSLLRAKVKVAPLVYSLATFSESEVQSLFWIASSRPRVGDLHPANTGSFSLGG